MAFFIIAPIFLLPCFFIFIYFYQRFFEGNLLILGFVFTGVFLALIIFGFYKLKWDEKLVLYTEKYGIRFNDERKNAGLPLLTSLFIKEDNCWSTTLDSIRDRDHFTLIQKCLEENDTHNGPELENTLLGKALSDSTVLYLQIQYNYITKNYYAETRTGKLDRPSYRVNKLMLFEDCCSRPFKHAQVDSILQQ